MSNEAARPKVKKKGASLKMFLKERMKVGGKADALGDSITVTHDKSKLTFTSDLNFSKRYFSISLFDL